MSRDQHFSRREFIERLGAGSLLGASGLCQNPARAASNPGSSWTPPPTLKNPNILVIMVDQLRLPAWLSPSQSAALSSVLPNIVGRLQNCSYNFGEFYVAATVCVPSRSAILTGLYAPQTAMYATDNAGQSGAPQLNAAYPTWGEAVAALNPAYQGNVWWFGKWHVSNELGPNPLAAYGYKTRTYPGGQAPPYNPSPDGGVNEGTDGGPFNGTVWAGDNMIAQDFVGWLNGQPPSNGSPSSPWCATVSLINPHDISFAPAWLQTNPFPPNNVSTEAVYFPPPANIATPPTFYTSTPSPWNLENLPNVPNKPALQNQYFTSLVQKDGPVTDWMLFLNQYFYLQNQVDQQINLVLNAMASSPFAGNTIIVFMSDHGEYAGSHGLHTKGFAVYDESLRVPFCVQFPGQTSQVAMNQMCSAVDVFGLICDLATGGTGQWMLAYPDLANRQSIWSFLYNNSGETRVAPAPVSLPYILHTCDEGAAAYSKPHITCIRTKFAPSSGAIGAKWAFYSDWAPCTTYPNSTSPDPEFYDYNPQGANNTAEVGNDYYSTNSVTQQSLANHQQVLGSWGSPGTAGTGIIGNELNAPLIGTGTDGNPLTVAQATAQQTFYGYAANACPS
ncbi:MAG: sulfatase-like hydrolase/transferase [Bryobacteraceae bacterium]|jgi:arylsulfatase A-like enzyme